MIADEPPVDTSARNAKGRSSARRATKRGRALLAFVGLLAVILILLGLEIAEAVRNGWCWACG